MRKILVLITLTTLIATCSSLLMAKAKITPKGRVNLRNGNMYLQQKNLEKAQSFLEEVLKENPNQVEATKLLADIQFAHAEEQADETKKVALYSDAYHKYEIVLSELAKESKLEKDEEEWKKDATKKLQGVWVRIYKIGIGLKDSREFDKSIPVLQTLIALNPQKTEGMKALLAVYRQQADELNDQKEELLEKSKDSDTKAIDDQIKQKDVLSEEMLNKILAITPDDADTQLNLAKFYQITKQYDKALPVYEKLLVQKPDNTEILFNVVTIEADLKHYAQAMTATEKILAIDPNNIDALVNAREFSRTLKDNKAEVAYMARIVALEKTESNLEDYCIVLYQNKMYPELLSSAREWYAMNNDSEDAVRLIILAAKELKQQDVVKTYTNILNLMTTSK